MAYEAVRLGAVGTVHRFVNGTTLQGLGHGLLHQRRPDIGLLRSTRLPSELDTHPDFDKALLELGIREQETLTLEADGLPAGSADTVVISPAPVADDSAPRVLLYQDESGGISWHYAQHEPVPSVARRPGLRDASLRPRQVFVVLLRSKGARATLRADMPRRSLRGPITKIGRKIFKVFVLPLLSKWLHDPMRWFGEQVEQQYRQNLVWQPTPDAYRTAPTRPFTDWQSLRGGPVLLIIHGIFSSVEGMLSGLSREAMVAWHRRYDGRVIAFNHLSVSVSPKDNSLHLLQLLHGALPGQPLTIDILCHSRGGIVARCLAERAAEILPAHTCCFRSVYFVATPNGGSPFGDADHMIDMIDLFTNCLGSFPDGAVSYSMEVLLGLVVLVGHAGVKALPGIAALGTGPESFVVKELNGRSPLTTPIYGAAAADFSPRLGQDNGWLLRLGDPLLDQVFVRDGQRIGNDLVVPQQGVFTILGDHPSFPIDGPLVYTAEDGVWHSGFFMQQRTLAHLEAHFDRVDSTASPDASARRRGTQRPGLRSKPEAGSAPPKPEAGGAPPVVERRPAIDFYERLHAGQSADLVVRLQAPGDPAATGPAIVLAFDPGSDEIDLVAELSAPGFSIDGASHASLRLLRQRDQALEQATFRLTAADPGASAVDRDILVSFFRGNDCVGSISHTTRVVPHHSSEGAPAAIDRVNPLRIARQRRETADLVLTLRRREPGRDVFELCMRSQVANEEYESRSFGTFDLDGQAFEAYFAQALDPIVSTFPGKEVPDDSFDAAVAGWNRRLLTMVQDLGQVLWGKLPQAWRAEYLRLAGLSQPPRSITIYSEELSFPWEIVRPSGSVDGQWRALPALGVSHVMGRWQPGTEARPQPQAGPVTRVALVMPDASTSGLAYAVGEMQALQLLLPGANCLQPVTRRGVEQLLSLDDVQIVHFSGHGVPGANGDLTALDLGDEVMPAMAFASARLPAVGHPLLYLNACTVGRGSKVLGRAGGFSGNCIQAGWSGVIAPYWPVYDPSAAEFGVAFYRKLKSGLAIGEALTELRQERPNDPTALAYAYFGDPFARPLLA